MWFYVGNQGSSLPEVTGHAPKHLEKWAAEADEGNEEVACLLKRIGALKAAGLTRVNVAASFLKHRIQPLKGRDRKGHEYLDFSDPTRMSLDDITNDEVEAILGKMFKPFHGVPVVEDTVRQFDHWYVPNQSHILTEYWTRADKSKGVSENEPQAPSAKKRRLAVKKQGAWK
ncbi:uncharacterized protein LOC111256948 [Setaria italica]|uniref:uncharacterized protein LOC111256948 n=1 Tax=Setaria italica TaxID=4555 RepID=UPI000BE594D8|nr:uncharacterized protein LOC111256948 [Setaria italica]